MEHVVTVNEAYRRDFVIFFPFGKLLTSLRTENQIFKNPSTESENQYSIQVWKKKKLYWIASIVSLCEIFPIKFLYHQQPAYQHFVFRFSFFIR